jgi:hypothetical protein
MDEKIDKGIADTVGALTDPIIVFPGGWGDTLPDWVREDIRLERLALNIQTPAGELKSATDSEAYAYLYTCSLADPMDETLCQIYIYLATKCMDRRSQNKMPAEMALYELTENQRQELDRLKCWIYEQRVKAREQKRKKESCQEKEEVATIEKEKKVPLFTL